MAHVFVLGAGLGGTIMAYELRDQLGPDDTITALPKTRPIILSRQIRGSRLADGPARM